MDRVIQEIHAKLLINKQTNGSSDTRDPRKSFDIKNKQMDRATQEIQMKVFDKQTVKQLSNLLVLRF